jgi:hypothetical protein
VGQGNRALRRKHVETAFLAGLMHRAGAALALKILSRFERSSAPHGCADLSQSGRRIRSPVRPLADEQLVHARRVQEAASEWRSYRDIARAISPAPSTRRICWPAHPAPAAARRRMVLDERPVFEQLGVFPGRARARARARDHVRAVAGM